MSAMTSDALWTKLLAHGLVEGERPADGDPEAPWFVRVMLGIAGWIGALFLLGFVGMGFSFVFKSSGAAFVAGVGACSAAVLVFRAVPKNDFVAQFGLAVSLAGQVLMGFGAAQWFEHSLTGIAIYLALQQGLLFILVPNFVHRLWSSWTSVLAVAFAMSNAGLFAFIPAATTAAFVWLALSEFSLARHGAFVRPGIYGLALAAVQAATLHAHAIAEFIQDHREHLLSLGPVGVWLGRLASAGVLLWTVSALLKREKLPLSSGSGRAAMAGALLLGLVSINAPGVAPAVAILVVGFANAERVLVGLGIFALLGYLSHFYYSLETTLLEKSGLLVAFGAVLLVVRLAMRQWWPEGEPLKQEEPHA